MTALDLGAIMSAVQSHAAASGWFEGTPQHEPKNAPGRGLTSAMWLQTIGPAPSVSGLASGTGLIVFNLRITTSMLAEPQDDIDPELAESVHTLLCALAGDYTLGGLVRNIDLRGQLGPGLSGAAGYLNQDGKLFRVFTLTVPVIVNDLWDESE